MEQYTIIPIDRTTLLTKIASQMKEKRFNHCLRVEKEILRLAKQQGVDEEQASLAALLHDYAKERPLEELQQVAQHYLPKEYHHAGSEILHGPVGALLLERELGLTDKTIQEAIVQHTIGGVSMTPLAKVLFLADYIEEGRDFPGVERARELAYSNIDAAIRYKLSSTITHLVAKQLPIFEETVTVYNAWIQR